MHAKHTATILLLVALSTLAAQDLPRGFSAEELRNLSNYHKPAPDYSGEVTPPGFPVRSMAEWEELQALVITWNTTSNARRDILTEIVRAAQAECRVIVCCFDQPLVNSAKNYLISKGVDIDTNVDFLIVPNNSIWVRDYGPNCVYGNDVDSLYLVDWIYNRNRPLDNALPEKVADHLNLELYQTTTAPYDLVHTGGNFMSDGMGTGFSSMLVLDENGPGNIWGTSNHSEEDVDQIMQEFMGINRYPKMTNLPYDLIHHIDMHMKLLDEQTLLVGEYPQGIADGPQIEANLLYVLDNYLNAFGEPYNVVRIPMPPEGQAFPNNGGDYRTYTNAVFVNKTILLPTYEEQFDTTAVRIWQEALPGYKIVGINSNAIIPASGAIHCITKEIGVNDPLRIVHKPLRTVWQNPLGPDQYPVHATLQHRSGIAGAKVWYRTDTTAAWESADMFPFQPADTANVWVGNIPRQETGDTVYYYIEAQANSGKTAARPMPAPKGYWTFRIDADISTVQSPETPVINPIFPNPARNLTCIPVQTKFRTRGQVRLINALGQVQMRIYEGDFPQGESRYYFDASRLAPGVYFVQMETAGGLNTRKVVVR